MKQVRDPKLLLWALLAVPAAHILYRYGAHGLLPDELVGPTGEWSARLLIVALMLTPLAMLLPRVRLLGWLLRRRRAFGVGAFGYALLHLAFYALEMETLHGILAELELFGIWTGWAALLLMLPLAATSNDAAMRALKGAWKKVQRLAYPAAILALIHWIVVHNALVEALAQSAPLMVLEFYRIARLVRSRHGLRGRPLNSPA